MNFKAPNRRSILPLLTGVVMLASLLAGGHVRGEDFPPPMSPEDSLNSIVLPEGFTAQLMAAEPMVMDPVAIEWGPDGKLWVVEMGDYPMGVDGKGAPGGRVRVLTDSNGDGKYDQSTLFLDGLKYPNGVLPWRKGVLITCAPDILYAEDTDGDGKADLKKVVLTGFNPGNPQLRVNGLRYGLDNWVFCANGWSHGKVTSPATGQMLDIRGMDLRFEPDTGRMELETGLSQYGRNRDDYDNWFGVNNSLLIWHFVLPDRYTRRNPHVLLPEPRNLLVKQNNPPCYPASKTIKRFHADYMANNFTSACATAIYRDDLLGGELHGNAFVCEPVHNLVRRYLLKPEGVSFEARQAPGEEKREFLAFKDNWARPVLTRTGPDGALWVVDMYRLVIEHSEWIPKEWQGKVDMRAGHDKGRIYRIFRKDAPPRPIARLDSLKPAGLVEAMETPNGWQRDMAQMMLVWAGGKEAGDAVRRLASQAADPRVRMQALGTAQGMGAIDRTLLADRMKDSHPSVRRMAVRLMEEQIATPQVDEWLKPMMELAAADAAPEVRLQAAFTLGQWKHPRSGQLIAKLMVKEKEHPYIQAAALSSANGMLPWIAPEVAKASEIKAERRQAALMLLPMAFVKGQEVWQFVLIPHIAPGEKEKLDLALLDSISAFLKLLMDRNVPADWWVADRGREQAMALNRIRASFDQARALAQKADADIELRLAAIRLLGRLPAQHRKSEDLLALIDGAHPAEVQEAAIAALSGLNDPSIPTALLGSMERHSPAIRLRVIDALIARQGWADDLLGHLKKNPSLAASLDGARRQRLLQHANPATRKLAEATFGAAINPQRGKVVLEYQKALAMKGDHARGKPLFESLCAACHKLRGQGGEIGPNLDALTDRAPGSLLTAILDPSRMVEPKFAAYLVVTRSSATHLGFLAEETTTSITLKAADGVKHSVLRSEIASMRAMPQSLMPEGLEAGISLQGMADLIEWINHKPPANVAPEK